MKSRIIVIALNIMVLSGCSAIRGAYEADPIMKQQSVLITDEDKNMVDTAKLEIRITGINNETNSDLKKEKRNQLVQELLQISDRVCSEHQSGIISNANTWNTGMGTAVNILSGLGTVLSGGSTQAALAAGAAFSSSSRSLVNEEVYSKSLGPTIVQAISIAREKYQAKIDTGMDKEFKDYSISQAVRDVQEYHRRCSFYYGIAEISKSLEQRKDSITEIENKILTLRKHRKELENNTLADKNVALKITKEISDIDQKISDLILQQASAPN